jgi:hypothetical protein
VSVDVPNWEIITEPPRDYWGRPLVIPPGGEKPIPYTRCTTFVDTLDDPFNLTMWKRRMVAIGLSHRPDLLFRVSSLGPEPPKDGDDGAAYRQWKKQLDETCDAAAEHAKASASATIGTALHALTERIDRGQDVGAVPAEYLPHLHAYEQATNNFTAVHIERFTVYDDYRIGGTPDRVLQMDGHSKLLIGDLKSGSVEYGLLKIAQQLAVYAHSQLYNHQTGQRAGLGNIDTERGVVIALNAKTGRCDLHWVDLVKGWNAVQISKQVRDARNWRDLATPLVIHPESARDLTVEAKAALATAIPQAASEDELIALWKKAGNQWTAEHTAMAAARRTELLKPVS